MNDVFVFDDGKGRLGPLTDLRAAFDVRTGAMPTLARLGVAWGFASCGLLAPEGLAGVTRERHPHAEVNPEGAADRRVLLLNGRWADCRVDAAVAEAVRGGSLLTDGASGDLVCGWARLGDAARLFEGDFEGYAAAPLPAPGGSRVLIDRPWHVRSVRDATIRFDLRAFASMRLRQRGQPEAAERANGEHAAVIDPGARVHPSAVFDTELGSVVIERDAVVRPGAIVCGPAYIGPHSHVLDRCLIKPNTAIGDHCRVAGEIGGTIFQGYANKAHDGHLGDSWIGEWANLGAGTTNSNLLNTYGEVVCRATPDGPNERTGETFLGCVIGDHAKLAICTRIMTGAIVGTGTMWAAAAPVTGTVPAFSWVVDGGVRGYRFDKFLEVARAAMARRKVTPSEAYVARLGSLHPYAIRP